MAEVLASWREAFRSELLKDDSGFPKEQFQVLTLNSSDMAKEGPLKWGTPRITKGQRAG